MIVDLEGTLQVLLNLHIEGLRFHTHERRVVHTRNSFGRDQMVQVTRKLCKLCARRLLLSFLLLNLHMLLKIFEPLSHFLVLKNNISLNASYLVLHVVQIGLSGIKIVLILSTVVPSIAIEEGAVIFKLYTIEFPPLTISE